VSAVTAADEAVRDGAADSVTFAFGDADAQLYGLARLGLSRGQGSALALLFSGREPVAALARGELPVAGDDPDWRELELGGVRTTIEEPLSRWTASFDAADGQGFALEFAVLGAAAATPPLGGMSGYEQPCRVRGTVRTGGSERAIDTLGQRGRAWGDADWQRIELARTVAAWTDSAQAALTAVRQAGAEHHADEATWAAVWESERLVEIADARLSTTYDADGHTRRAGLELWPPGEDEWARRGAGEVLCGSSLDLGALRLDCAFFRWHLEGHAGVGRYDIVRRIA
jgi:hypothetical protein